MSEPQAIPRSPELMSRHDTGLLVVDVQEKLLPHISNQAQLIWNIRRLLDAAAVLGLVIRATEQYPRGLGATSPEIADRIAAPAEKLTFSCRECTALIDSFREQGIDKLLVAGIEAHVCIQQTVLDLLSAGFRIYVPVDAVGSRRQLDAEVALRRLDSAGATLTTVEAAMFEWCDVAGTPEFKKISGLVRETPPT